MNKATKINLAETPRRLQVSEMFCAPRPLPTQKLATVGGPAPLTWICMVSFRISRPSCCSTSKAKLSSEARLERTSA